jgi:hypothetical protein
MMTRRTVLGIGMTVASSALATGFKAYAAPPTILPKPVDALLVDKNVQLPRPIAAYINARRRLLPVVAIDLDAAGYSGLMNVLTKSDAVAGISSGATLFCLERLAWDYGYRLTGRTPRCLSAIDEQSCSQDIAAFLTAAHSMAVRASPETRAYRPSHSDDTLHSWVMQKSASAPRHHSDRLV